MRDQCPDEGFTCDGGDLTVSWSYVSTYTGANFGGGTYDGPAPSPDPGSGGGTSDELGDCSCYCDADLTDFAGNVNVCDGNGGDCGVTSAQCSSLGPDQGCPSSAMSDDGSTLSPTWDKSCSTYYVEWSVNPSYSSGHSHDDSGSSDPVGDCECLCPGGGSFNPEVFPNHAGPDAGGVTQSECESSSGISACKQVWEDMFSSMPPCSSGSSVDDVYMIWTEGYTGPGSSSDIGP